VSLVAEWVAVEGQADHMIACASHRSDGYNEFQILSVGPDVVGASGGRPLVPTCPTNLYSVALSFLSGGRVLDFFGGGFPASHDSCVTQIGGSLTFALGAVGNDAVELWKPENSQAGPQHGVGVLRRSAALSPMGEPTPGRRIKLVSPVEGVLAGVSVADDSNPAAPDAGCGGDAVQLWDVNTATALRPALQTDPSDIGPCVDLIHPKDEPWSGCLVVAGANGYGCFDVRTPYAWTASKGSLRECGGGPLEAACVAGHSLYAASEGGRMVEVDLRKGRVASQWRLSGSSGGSVAQLEAQAGDQGVWLSLARRSSRDEPGGLALYRPGAHGTTDEAAVLEPCFRHQGHGRDPTQHLTAHTWHPRIRGLVASVASNATFHIWSPAAAACLL